MATAKVCKESQNTLVCTLCLDQFKAPRLLPCFHTFCEDCLCAHIVSQTADSSTFKCPLCKVVISPTDKNKDVEIWAADFPLNHLLISVMETISKPAKNNKLCDPCHRSDESTTATFWCEQCREKLCVMCHKYHSRMKWQSAHNTIPLDNLKEEMEMKMELPEVTCPRHAGKEIEVYCIDHQEVCCTVCLLLDHRKCKDIETVDNMAVNFLHRNSNEKFLSSFDNVKGEIMRIVAEREKNKVSINEESGKVFRDIDNAADKAKQKIDTLSDALKESCRVSLAKHMSALSDSSNTATKFLTNIETCRQIIEVALRHGSAKNLFVMYNRLWKQMMTHFSQIKSEISEDKVVTLTYKNEDLESKIKVLGNLGSSTSQETIIPEALISVNNVMEQMNRKLSSEIQAAQVPMTVDLMTSPVVHVKTVTEADLGRGRLELIAGLYVNDGRLLVSDFGNKRLLLLDQDMKFEKEIKLGCCPTDIVRDDTEHNVYVAGRGPSTVLCLDIKNDFKVKKTINIKGNICGIDFTGGYIFAAVDEVGVKKMTTDGSVLSTFPGKGSWGYVSVSQKQERLYHTDGDAVVCRSLDGEELFRCENASLRGPKGICFDTIDNIYVCGWQSGNIHQISSDGKKSRVLIDKLQQIRTPWRVVYHPEHKTLLVTANSNNVGVCFELYEFFK